jgi:carnosine N-methyltransferase
MSDAFDRMDSESRALGISVGYHLKLDALAQAEEANAKVTNAIADLAIREHGLNRSEVATGRTGPLFRAREALQHFVRDWSEEGSAERKVIATPILDVLRDERRAGQMQRVLVPGSGLGRLAWDISELGKLRLVPAACS